MWLVGGWAVQAVKLIKLALNLAVELRELPKLS